MTGATGRNLEVVRQPGEQYFSVSQFAAMLSISYTKALGMVMREPGVVVIPPEAKAGVRAKRMYRIPQSVVDRLLKRLCNPAPQAGA